MGIKEDALELHRSGFNCAQSVLCACCKYTGLDEKTALAISGGFGGGVRCGEVCGALSGAVMAIGCAYPYSDYTDTIAKNRIAELTKNCTNSFSEHFSCLRCFDLKQAGVNCGELIGYASELAEKMIITNKQEN